MIRTILTLLTITAISGFAPVTTTLTHRQTVPSAPLSMGFGIDPERKPLTRENEPEDFFSTNTDKMSDKDKIPIAIAGLVGISLPFILGLIALYSAK